MKPLLHSLPFLLLFFLPILCLRGSTNSPRLPCKFPAIYNFGDSNSDTGAISAAFLPIPPPYGTTFFNRPAGRDSDGRNIIDFLTERLGLPFLSAYLNSIGANFTHGANFATGGSTIRRQNETIFEHSISPFSLDVQIWHYDQFRSRTAHLYSVANGDSFHKSVLPNPDEFNKALYTFDIGQNDLSVGFRTMSNRQLLAVLPDILAHFSAAIQHLYEEGGRYFWIHNTGPFGCMPVNIVYAKPQPENLDQYGCVKTQNDVAVEFNKQLKDTIAKLRNQLPEAAITYVDAYAAKYGLIRTANTQGFDDPRKICCGYHEKDGNVWCGLKGQIYNGSWVFGGSCEKPERSISWDGVHYTEASNHWFANHMLSGSLSDPPLSISQGRSRSRGVAQPQMQATTTMQSTTVTTQPPPPVLQTPVYGTPAQPQHYTPYQKANDGVYDEAPAVKSHASYNQAPAPAKGAVHYESAPYQQPKESTLPYQESAPVYTPNYASNINMYSSAQSANAMGRLG